MVRDVELTDELAQSNRETIYHHLQEDLLRQMQLCARNQQMYAQMEGPNNIKQANEFKILEQRCARDLDRLKQCFQQGLKAPVFHYEKRQMNIIQVNNDLTDDEVEVKKNYYMRNTIFYRKDKIISKYFQVVLKKNLWNAKERDTIF